jgi:hypothetical protein
MKYSVAESNLPLLAQGRRQQLDVASTSVKKLYRQTQAHFYIYIFYIWFTFGFFQDFVTIILLEHEPRL